MLRVGLTGGIAAGKSTVSGRLAELGAVVVDADLLAREVVALGTDGLAEVVERFGPSVLAEDGSLDRAALGAVVFSDADARRDLAAITHPRIARLATEAVAAAPEDAVVVHDVPLLVENGLAPAYHLVVVVAARTQERVRRLVADRGMAEDDAWARVRAQASDDERRAVADVWLDNQRPVADVLADVDRLWRERLVPYERNVRTRTPVRRPEVVRLAAYDATWPARAARVAARVTAAAGDLARGVEHVGSTSVPGLAAKDVLDLQVGVGSVSDLAAVGERLSAAGFPVVVADATDTVLPAVDPVQAHWRKAFHAGTDPAEVVHLHVREHGGPGWRTALLLRDWLRAEAGERAAYEAHKRRLVAGAATTSDYAEAKEPWFGEVLPRALEWARKSPER